VPYLTPETLPEETDCRSLLIPASSDWLAIVSGALTELVKAYNWEQLGAVTVDEAIAAMQLMIDGYYEGCEEECLLPDGDPIFRINPDTWEIEQLVDGSWVAPEGEFEIPPTEARTEPTSEERRCLAAANAVNALAIMYEQLADSFAANQELSVAAGAFASAIAGAIGAIFGIVVAPLIALYAAIFAVVYETVEYITDDLWDEDFTDKLECIFYECSLDVDEVVHFDIQCIINQIGASTEIDYTFSEVRLLLQVAYLLQLSGSQMIDAAGTATAIEEAVCDDCDDDWCFTFDLTETDADGTPLTLNGCTAAWSSGLGWYTTKGSPCAVTIGENVITSVNIEFAEAFIKRVVVVGTSLDRTTGNACAVAFPAINRGGTPSVTCVNITNGDPHGTELIVNGLLTGITAEFQNTAPSGVTHATGTAVLEQVTFYGTGDCPFGIPNCLP